jgi:acetate kinase
MIIMAINAGSSSLKFQIINMPEELVLCSGIVERIGQDIGRFKMSVRDDDHVFDEPFNNHEEAVEFTLNKLIELKIIDTLDEIDAVGHRVVHGGESFAHSVLITEEVIDEIDRLKSLAPLHNPANLIGIKAIQAKLDVPMVAVFDTAFHQTMPKENYLYAVPYDWYESYGVRKYGFHGTSHQYVSVRAAEILKIPIEDSKIIVCHIGNGASLCAVDGGISIDTSMGFTPLAGIPMGTRSGDIDPAIIEYMAQKENKSLKEVTNELNKASGYLGISGISSDSRDLWKASHAGDERAQLALEIQAKMIADYIGAYYLQLGRCDAICFTAGIGENAAETRALIVNKLHALNIHIDSEKNKQRGEVAIISTDESSVKVMTIPTNEEVMIARDTLKYMN